MTNEKSVLIVGCGIFGVSTAIELLEQGYKSVKIIDRAAVVPAEDAASYDLNKIIRAGDYDCKVLAKMSLDAVEEWRTEKWEGTYHESGALILADQNDSGTAPADEFALQSYQSVLALNLEPIYMKDSAAIAEHYKDYPHILGEFKDMEGYLNKVGGWAEARRALEVGMKRVKALGGTIEAGVVVKGLKEVDGKVEGVLLANGEILTADLYVIATGAWTPSVFSTETIGLTKKIKATGQSVAKVQLTPAEAEEYSKMPVVLNFSSGAYVFPPTSEGIVKIAIHHAGHESLNADQISEPKTVLTPGFEDGYIPKTMVKRLRESLSKFYPELAKKDFSGTRLCWYTESENGEFLIDYHSTYKNVFFATAGSGHAFKFFPVIGKYIVQRIEGTLSEVLNQKWSWSNRSTMAGADHRPIPWADRYIVKSELATADDLKA